MCGRPTAPSPAMRWPPPRARPARRAAAAADHLARPSLPVVAQQRRAPRPAPARRGRTGRPSRCRPMTHRPADRLAAQEISAPRTRVSPGGAAAAAAAQPAVVSWSVRATTSSPAGGGPRHDLGRRTRAVRRRRVDVQIDAHEVPRLSRLRMGTRTHRADPLSFPCSPTAHSTRCAGSRSRTPTSAPSVRRPSRSTSATTASSPCPGTPARGCRHPGARRRRLGFRRDVRRRHRSGRPPRSPSTSPGPAATSAAAARSGSTTPRRPAARTPHRTCATRSRCRCRRRSSTCWLRRRGRARAPARRDRLRRGVHRRLAQAPRRSARPQGSRIEQTVLQVGGGLTALGHRRGRGADPVLPELLPRPVRHRRLGAVLALDLAGHALATAREAVALLTAPELPYREDATVVLESSQLVAAGARVDRPPARARPHPRHGARLRRHQLRRARRPGPAAVRRAAHHRHRRRDDARRHGHVRLRRRGRRGRQRGPDPRRAAGRLPHQPRDGGRARVCAPTARRAPTRGARSR